MRAALATWAWDASDNGAWSDEVHIEPGTRIGAYVVERLRGRGGMASVYQAHRFDSGEPVALKLLDVPVPSMRARFLREGRAQASVDHPNVVRVFDVGYSPERRAPFLVMEMLEGETLSERRERNRMPAQDAVDLNCRSCPT